MKEKKYVILVLILCFMALSYYIVKVVYSLSELSYRERYSIKLSNEEVESFKNELRIQNVGYSWVNGLNMNNKPKIIIFHHTAIKKISAEEIDKLHRNKGWEGIGYHYFITKDGTIYVGRPEKAEGAHTIGKNKESIGICVEGNLEEEEMTLNQIASAENLAEYLCLKYDIEDILQHKDFANTLCPGKNFAINEIKDFVIKDLKNLSKKSD